MKHLNQLALIVSGYASLFGRRDMSGDVVKRGAFSASLLSQQGRKFPMLFAHETKRPVGVWDRVFEDETGLFVEGRLWGGTAETDEVLRLVQGGAVSGLSIGYKTRRAAPNQGGRLLTEIDLFEISLVAFPMLRDARIINLTLLEGDET